MKHFFTLILFSFVLLLSSCFNKDDSASSKLFVVSTTGMIHDMVINVGGDHIRAVSLMGPGVDPHLYKASEGDVSKLSKAKVIFYNGLHLEAKMVDVLEKMSAKKPVIAVTSALPTDELLSPPAFSGYHDPHVWFDVLLWSKAIEAVKTTLIKADPVHKSDYEKNAAIYLKALEDIHSYVEKRSQELKPEQRLLVTAHDAFGYFGKRYGFEVHGLQGISTQTEAGTKDVQRLSSLIVERKVNAMFVESSVPERNIKAVQASAKSKGWDVAIGGHLYSDAMGDAGTEEGSYVGMVRHNIDTIVSALKGKNK